MIDRQSGGRRARLLPLLAAALALPAFAAGPEPRTWLPEPGALSPAVADSNPQTYQVLCTAAGHDPCDLGLEWREPARAGELVIDYVTFGGRAYQPAPEGQMLESWTGDAWQPLAAAVEIDYRGQGEFAPLQGIGTARWTYRFDPVETTRLRVLLTAPQNSDPGHRCYGVREIRAGPGQPGPWKAGFRTEGELPSMPSWLEPGANLAAGGAGARIIPGKPAEIRWPRRMLVNHVRASSVASPLEVEWWDGERWRPVEPLPAGNRPGEARFLPVATERLRVGGSPLPLRSVEARLDSEAQKYFQEVRDGRVDLLGMRFRSMSSPDLGAMRGLLLPLDFAKAAIGRPADLEETMVLWNGAFLMVEEKQHGAEEKDRGEKRDRWFAPAAGDRPELFGTQWAQAASRYLDGYLPATVTTYRQGGFSFEETLYVTAPGDPLYGTVAEITITNQSEEAEISGFTLALGRRRNQWSPDETAGPLPDKSTALFFDAEETGYTLDADQRTVRSSSGEIVLYAEDTARWQGTPRENHLAYAVSLIPGESRKLRFFAPSVEQPMRSSAPLQSFDWDASLARFRAWWREKLAQGMQLELPEPRLNDVYKNLLAQALIITLDGDSLVRYGAYFYEMYFGMEEGWPSVALAQYGYAAEAQKIAAAMLSPELMDKNNYHHQYRNGLDPWYAATIYRLTKDRAWLERIAPDLEKAAEWTLRVTTENKDAKYAGLLPRHAYGGDIHTPAYSLYSNATCWRGLNDTALVFGMLGRAEQAQRYRQAADGYRRRIWALADELADRQSKPPFLPMSFELGAGADYKAKEPSYSFLAADVPARDTWTYLGNYWNLLAPGFEELRLFPAGDPRAAWVPDYMETHGGVLAGLARFTLGLDQIYGKGYYESLLERGERGRFLTSLYGIFAHGMSQSWNSFPEVAGVFPLRTSNAALWREHRRNLWNWYFFWKWGFEGWQNSEGEPLSAGPGMALQILRMALVRETASGTPGRAAQAADPASAAAAADQQALRLLDGAPPHWFEPGKQIVIRNAPTFFGPVSLETEAAAGSIRASMSFAGGSTAREVILRLPHPSGRLIRHVEINGRPWRDFSGVEIRLPVADHLEITAAY